MKKYRLYRLGMKVGLPAAVALLMGTVSGHAQTAPAPSPSAKPSGASNSGTAPSAQVSTSPDKVVLKVGDKQVTAEDVDFLIHSLNPQDQRTLATQPKGKEVLADNYVTTLVLQQQALRDHLEQSREIQRQEALEHVQRLAQAEYDKIAKNTAVSDTEVSEYFAAHPKEFEQVQTRAVSIRIKPATAQADAPGLTADEAKAKAETIRKALAAPGADPAKVSKDFTVQNVVFVDNNIRTFGHNQLPPEIESKVFAAKDGEFTEPVDYQQQSIIFFQIVKQNHSPQLKDAQQTIENTLKQEKLRTAVQALKSKATVWLDPDYFKPAASPAAAESPAPNKPTAASAPRAEAPKQ